MSALLVATLQLRSQFNSLGFQRRQEQNGNSWNCVGASGTWALLEEDKKTSQASEDSASTWMEALTQTLIGICPLWCHKGPFSSVEKPTLVLKNDREKNNIRPFQAADSY